jgi:hypothetical protein
MLSEPKYDYTRGFIWVGVTTFIFSLISSFSSVQTLRNTMNEYFGSSILYYVCGVILAPIFAIIGLAISTGIYHLSAKLFHGNGKWGDLAYCLSAVLAPSTVVGGVISLIILLFSQIPALMFIPILLSMVLGIYMLVLYVNAIRAAENIGTGQATGTILVPVIVVGILFLCVALALIPAFSKLQ